jgi:hypothetical protein
MSNERRHCKKVWYWRGCSNFSYEIGKHSITRWIQIIFRQLFFFAKFIPTFSRRRIRAAATIQENRIKKCPLQSAKQVAKQSRGSYDFQTSNDEDVLVVRWKDNRVCTSITTYSTAEEISVARWSREEKKKVIVPQPKVFADYNKGMGGVNKTDQLIACYRTRMRLRKWWWPIFIYLFDSTLP